jgi:hypothetical protein
MPFRRSPAHLRPREAIAIEAIQQELELQSLDLSSVAGRNREGHQRGCAAGVRGYLKFGFPEEVFLLDDQQLYAQGRVWAVSDAFTDDKFRSSQLVLPDQSPIELCFLGKTAEH